MVVVVSVGRGLQGLHPGQSSTAFGGAEHFPAATAEQFVDIPVPRGGRDLPSAASSSDLPGTANLGGFSHFSPWEKSARFGPHPMPELGADFSSSPPAPAELEGFFTDAAGVWMQFPAGWWKLLGSDPEVWRPG